MRDSALTLGALPSPESIVGTVSIEAKLVEHSRSRSLSKLNVTTVADRSVASFKSQLKNVILLRVKISIASCHKTGLFSAREMREEKGITHLRWEDKKA